MRKREIILSKIGKNYNPIFQKIKNCQTFSMSKKVEKVINLSNFIKFLVILIQKSYNFVKFFTKIYKMLAQRIDYGIWVNL